LLTLSFWGSVVHLGAAAFKYLVRPDGDTLLATAAAAPQGSHCLREELLSRLAEGPIKWRLCVQLFADEEHTPHSRRDAYGASARNRGGRGRLSSEEARRLVMSRA
jgi:hypothetical protein